MDPWVSVVLFGIAVFGFAWLMPKRSPGEQETGVVGDAAYDRLLEDLELENRELVDAVAKFKQEQDETVHRLGNRIVELERQMKVWAEQPFSTPAAAKTTVAEPDINQEPASAEASADEVPVPLVEAYPTAAEEELVLPPTSIRARYADLIAQHDKGRSMEQIAKSAGMNKGEVQLILQLARREEDQLA